MSVLGVRCFNIMLIASCLVAVIGCTTVKTGYIDPAYINNLRVYKNGSNLLDKDDIAYCQGVAEQKNYYYPEIAFKACLAQRGYMLLN